MTTWRPAAQSDVETAADAIVSMVVSSDARPGLGLGLVVSVDGPAGSGKTTLATRIADAAAAGGRASLVMHMDDLYAGWDGLDGDLEARVMAQVLVPLAEGRHARWQRYDWGARQFTTWEDVAPDPDGRRLLVLEGCGSGAEAYAAFVGRLVWVEAPAGIRIRRGLDRDGERMRPYWVAWMDSEARHFAANRTRDRADDVLDTGAL